MNWQNNKEFVAKTLKLLLKCVCSLEENNIVLTISCKRKDHNITNYFEFSRFSDFFFLNKVGDKNEFLIKKLAKVNFD